MHGVKSDPISAWRASNSEDRNLWPVWLGEDLLGAATWTIGYDAALFKWSGAAMPIGERARSLLPILLNEPRLKKGRIVFVGHSMGGLVIQQILRELHDADSMDAEEKSFLERIHGLVLPGVPHKGSGLLSGLNKIILPFLKPSDSTQDLVRNSAYLRELNVFIRKYKDRSGLKTMAFRENRRIPFQRVLVEASLSR